MNKPYHKRPKKQKKSAFDGWIALNKPLGMGSTEAVNAVKRLLQVSLRGNGADAETPPERHDRAARNDHVKIGHCGTLDPLADGVLILALGEATKLVQYVMDLPKRYDFTVTWGEQRDTDDAEGEVIARSDKRPAIEEIKKILPQYTGVIGQVPPKYSAIKIGGERAYDLARAGEEVEIAPRPVIIHSIECTENNGDSAAFSALCGKGTYVRSLARDMAQTLATKGYISALTRSSLGKCDLEHTISLEKLEKLVHNAPSTSWLHPVEWMLDDIPAWNVPPGIAKILRHGNTVTLIPDYTPDALKQMPDGELISISYAETLLALCEKSDDLLKPVRVFNLRGQRPVAGGQ